MKKVKKNKSLRKIILSLMLIGAIGSSLLLANPLQAQTENESTPTLISNAEADENVTAVDLGIKEPKMFSNNFFYSLKEAWNSIDMALTFNPTKKAEKQMKRASEKLIEAKKLIEEKNQPERANKALQKYEQQMSRFQKTVKRIEQKGEANLEKLTDRIVDNSWQHQNLINALEKKIDPQYFQEVEQAREQSLQAASAIIEKFIPEEKMEEKMESLLNKQKGSEFKDLQNLQNLKSIEGKISSEKKEKIQAIQKKVSKEFFEKMEAMDQDKKSEAESYLKEIGGNELQKLKIIEEVSQRDNWINSDRIKEEIVKKAGQKIELLSEEDQKDYLKNLSQSGDLSELRLIKDLEYSLSSSDSVKGKIQEAKEEILRKINQNLNTSEGSERVFRISNQNDVEQLDALEEIKKSLPSEKQEALKEMEEKIANNIRQKISSANNAEEKENVLNQIASDQPELMKVIQSSKALDQNTKAEILKKQTEKIEKRIQTSKDSATLEKLQERVRKEEQKGEPSGEMIKVRERIEEKMEEIQKEEKRINQPSSETNRPRLNNSLENNETKEGGETNLPGIQDSAPPPETDKQIINLPSVEPLNPQIRKEGDNEQSIQSENSSPSLSSEENQKNQQGRR
ncbi:DUF5667 domain-containing protein [Patescibacteria group bacterium]|nr:DUF5667 domain-containing protein [Patescibacteria group bacterium]